MRIQHHCLRSLRCGLRSLRAELILPSASEIRRARAKQAVAVLRLKQLKQGQDLARKEEELRMQRELLEPQGHVEEADLEVKICEAEASSHLQVCKGKGKSSQQSCVWWYRRCREDARFSQTTDTKGRIQGHNVQYPLQVGRIDQRKPFNGPHQRYWEEMPASQEATVARRVPGNTSWRNAEASGTCHTGTALHWSEEPNCATTVWSKFTWRGDAWIHQAVRSTAATESTTHSCTSTNPIALKAQLPATMPSLRTTPTSKEVSSVPWAEGRRCDWESFQWKFSATTVQQWLRPTLSLTMAQMFLCAARGSRTSLVPKEYREASRWRLRRSATVWKLVLRLSSLWSHWMAQRE